MIMDHETKIGLFRHAEKFDAFKKGDVVFKENDPGHIMYVVKQGEVELKVGTEVVEVVKEGGVFGEMSMLDHSPRSGTATALTDCELVAIDEKRFLYMVPITPFFALVVMRVMARRLRAMDKKAEASQHA